MPIPDFALRGAPCVNAGKNVTLPTLQAVQFLEVHHALFFYASTKSLKTWIKPFFSGETRSKYVRWTSYHIPLVSTPDPKETAGLRVST